MKIPLFRKILSSFYYFENRKNKRIQNKMVVVFQVGKAPITYSSNICSCAFFITLILYVAAIVLPYLLGGLTLNFFTPYEVRAERPMVYANPDMEYTLTGANTNLFFKLDNNSNVLSQITRIPVIQLPQKREDRFLKFSTFFPLRDDETIQNVKLSFTFIANFTEMNRAFTAYVDIDETTYLSACSLNIFGSMSFIQELALNNNRKTDVPLSAEYIQFTRTRAIPVNSSNPLVGGEPIFLNRNAIWTFGKCNMFEIHFSMRIPIIKTFVERQGWYSFLDGWTTYIAIAIPMFLIVWMALEAFFKSGMVPIKKEIEAELNDEKIPKFNR
ncbi:hypothetical protein TRFO_28538 [Tritrichomonas foetus]|uniref:Uncharacterized protein n=1 Tax=Tritrichomonas foetus TaxID=1144522 RepID=A0A1J4JY07_9EUKA|nr:hypothetical protein TRFO_28538 [Tritrichomonas foetus]|eukprot:OHT04041.1 hypothetical protein TRFO_28538 [Tritrichomonas foetus]